MTTPHSDALVTVSVSPDSLDRNPENPRLIFHAEELNELIDSISQHGVLVPLVVFESETTGQYTILDGERRWRAARRLNMSSLPVNIIPKPDPISNILMMFNIHGLREQWDLLPMALKLRDLMDLTGVTSEREISRMTGLPVGTVRRSKRLLALPNRYLERLMEELRKPRRDQLLSEDVYLEIMAARSVVESRVPELFSSIDKTRFVDSLVKKKIDRVVVNTTDYRMIPKVARAVDRGVPRSQIVNALKRLLKEPQSSIKDAYDSTVTNMYAGESLLRDLRRFEGQLDKAIFALSDPVHREEVANALIQLHARLTETLRNRKLIE